MIMLRGGRKEDEMLARSRGAGEGVENEIYCVLGPITLLVRAA